MGTDYNILIHRKCDNKLLGKVNCNMIKNIFDSEYSEKIHCTGRMSAHNIRFEYSDLHDIETVAFTDIEKLYGEILEKKFMITCASNVDIKNELEQDIYCIKDKISDISVVSYSSAYIQGMIATVVENLLKNPKNFEDKQNISDEDIFTYNIPAYEYNMEDVKSNEKLTKHTIWVDDVYCVIEAC